jgi:hypothetical protein
MRLFGLCSIRVALEASLTSRRRFGTCAIAPKTSSERIVILLVHTRSILFRGLVCPDGAYCTRNAIIERHIESPNLIELQGLIGRGISSCVTVIRTVCRQFGNGSKFGASTKKSDGNPGPFETVTKLYARNQLIAGPLSSADDPGVGVGALMHCPDIRFYVQVDWICKHWPTYW